MARGDRWWREDNGVLSYSCYWVNQTREWTWLRLMSRGGKRIAKRWGTRIMENSKGELTAAMVSLPCLHSDISRVGLELTSRWMWKFLFQLRRAWRRGSNKESIWKIRCMTRISDGYLYVFLLDFLQLDMRRETDDLVRSRWQVVGSILGSDLARGMSGVESQEVWRLTISWMTLIVSLIWRRTFCKTSGEKNLGGSRRPLISPGMANIWMSSLLPRTRFIGRRMWLSMTHIRSPSIKESFRAALRPSLALGKYDQRRANKVRKWVIMNGQRVREKEVKACNLILPVVNPTSKSIQWYMPRLPFLLGVVNPQLSRNMNIVARYSSAFCLPCPLYHETYRSS
jgi:hypothetical protein